MPFWLTQYAKSLGENLGQVTPLIYRSGHLPARRLRQLRGEGICLMLNLRDSLPQEEIDEILDAKIELCRVPMADDRAPSVEQISAALDVLKAARLKLVCCKGGRHRTGLIVACYRTAIQGWSKERAWEEAEHFGWYDTFGHKPLRIWFEKEFDPYLFGEDPGFYDTLRSGNDLG